MSFTVGQKLRASQANALIVKEFNAACNLALTLTGTETDVPGCTVTFSTTGGNTFVYVIGTLDISSTVTTSNNIAIGRCNADGATLSGEIHSDDRVSRITTSNSWITTLAAGSHTIKLTGKLASAGTMSVQTIHSKITVLVFDYT